MKVRSCFVSNSSTSSFVVVGFEIDEDMLDFEKVIKTLSPADYEVNIENNPEWKEYDEEERYEVMHEVLMDMDDYYYCNNFECGKRKNKALIGLLIAEAYEKELSSSEESLLEILDRVLILAKKLGLSDVKPKLYTGTRMR